MATNVLAPTGLVWSNNLFGATDARANNFRIKKGYATAIGIGDLVKTGTSGNQGYVVLGALNDSTGLGVFGGVLPYFDTVAQQTMHGLNGSWPTSANPSGDVDCVVYSNLSDVFRIQGSGAAYTNSMRGNNINFLTGTIGVPNAVGISTLTADMASVATTNTFPLRIVGVAGTVGGPQDPNNTNPTLLVTFNPGWLESMLALGI